MSENLFNENQKRSRTEQSPEAVVVARPARAPYPPPHQKPKGSDASAPSLRGIRGRPVGSTSKPGSQKTGPKIGAAAAKKTASEQKAKERVCVRLYTLIDSKLTIQ